jgi:tripartite-type tricarboxylate transporter receptor subunit TctC
VVRPQCARQHAASGNIDKIAEACNKAMRNPQATERLRGDTAQPVGDTPAQYGAFIKTEQARWKEVVARAKIKPD